MISIVLCTYNNAEYLETAVNSVLRQTITDWELVIIDDGSTDHTEQILGMYSTYPSISLISNFENRGKACCLNQAMKVIKGEWMLELDADDWLEKDCIEKINLVLNQMDQDIGLIYGNYVEWRERSRDKKLFYAGIKRGSRNFDIKSYLTNPSPLAPRLYRVKLLHKVNGWHTTDIFDSRLYEDVYMICLVSKNGMLKHLNEVLYHRRLRLDSVSNTPKGTYEEWKQWLLRELNIKV
ncbi:glycosyltransferase family 2 protein [Sutcliffiella halmapala]|uniref:glycosyltransferase family 2 protein n=1 Tax=Sutcliffiella halmapala TaxID=79882 RepID=UPI000995978B|nr:glycosyltransferase family 2 protein [Sutcliffiella halmapala]